MFGCGPTARCPRAAAAGCRKLQPDCYDTVCKPQPPPICATFKTSKNCMFFNRFAFMLHEGVLGAADCSSGTKMSLGRSHFQSK